MTSYCLLHLYSHAMMSLLIASANYAKSYDTLCFHANEGNIIGWFCYLVLDMAFRFGCFHTIALALFVQKL